MFNILMYSHDTFGLGHLRRTMAIASQLRAEDVNILILTGSSLAGRFDLPDGVDYVRIPGMIKKGNDDYLPQSIRINAKHVVNIRRNIIVATAKAFGPDLFLVDKAPLGLRQEVLPTLKWIKRASPKTKSVLGLRDIMDDSASTIRDWTEKGIYEALDSLYSEIWVYGERRYYDPVREYAIPERISRKMVFTGYIPRAIPRSSKVATMRSEECVPAREKVVLVTTGGGGDGYPVLDAYLRMLENMGGPPPFRSIVVSGPYMARAEREAVAARCGRLRVTFHHFVRKMETLLGMADVVVCMGGYNTTCEILSQRKVSLLIPREVPRLEQLIRARVFAEHGLVDYLPFQEVTPKTLHDKVMRLLDDPDSCCDGISGFAFTGLDVIRQRLAAFRAPAGTLAQDPPMGRAKALEEA